MPQLRTADLEPLKELLLAEQTALEKLHATLIEEQTILEQNDIDALPPLIEQKAEQLENISQQVTQRAEYLQTLGLENSRADMEEAFSKAATLGEELQKLLQQNIAIMEACHKQNEINGLVIEVGRQTTGFVLDLLQKTDTETSTTYNKKGKTSQSNGKPPLAKA